jgi:phosphoglycolate phosphatase
MTTADFLTFDLDGTLSDPAVGIERSLNQALRSFGYRAVPQEQVGRYIGPPLDEIFSAITGTFNPERIAALVARYRECYASVGCRGNRLYPEIREVLERLFSQGVGLGICTSKRADFAEQVLENFGIRNFFSFVCGGDIGVKKTRQLAGLLVSGQIPHSAAMIGDRAVDIHAARDNGLLSVGVLWGYGSREELVGAHPDKLVESPSGLLTLVDAG